MLSRTSSLSLARLAGPLLLAILLLAAVSSRALTPVALALRNLAPPNQARAVAPTQPISFTFNQSLYPASYQALFVYSARRGGLRTVTVPAAVSTSVLSYTPPAAAPWLPGETIETILTTALRGTSGPNIYLTRAQVRRFVAAVGGTGQGRFVAAPDVAVGSGAQAVALADVSGDGLPDLLTANATAGTVSVRCGNGAGTYAAPATGAEVPAGPGAAALAPADLDQDGDLDLVVACPADNTARVLFNGGTGNFSAGAVLATGTTPASLALGDLNGDGRPDLAVANKGAATVSCYLSAGAGTFGAAVSVAVGSQPAAVVLADLDNDLDLDMLTANAGAGTVSYCLNGGTGSFGAAASVAVGAGPTGLALADVDGDYDLDLLTANATAGTVSVCLNTGLAAFGGGVELAGGGAALALADVDGDADPDLLTVDAAGQTSLRLNANGRFGPAPAAWAAPALGTGVGGLLLADVDGDQDLDLLAPASSGAVRVALNQPSTLAALAITSTTPAANAGAVARSAGVAIGFSQALATGAGPNLQVFGSQSGGRRTGVVPATASGSTLSFAGPGGTGWLPGETVSYTVAAGTPATSGVALARGRVGQFTTTVGGTGRASFVAAPTVAAASTPFDVALGDVTGDGRPDMLVLSLPPNTTTLTLTRYAGTGTGQFGPGAAITVPGYPQNLVLGDVDGDGDLDAVCSSLQPTTNSLVVLLNDGQGNFTVNAGQPAIGGGSKGATLADLDADGDLDLLLCSTNTYGISIHLNDGTGSFAPAAGPPLLLANQPNQAPTVGDIDNDGDLDVLSVGLYSLGASPVVVFLNDGTGNFGPGVSSTNGPLLTRGSSLALADVDGNGTLDLLAADYATNQVLVCQGSGTGTFAAPSQVLGVGGPAWRVLAADLDADHDPDLLTVLDSQAGAVAVALNTGGTFTLTTPIPTGARPFGAAVADLDLDGDLDVVTADYGAATATVALNGGTVLAAQAGRAAPMLTLWPNPTGAGGTATLTGAAPGTPVRVLDALGRVVAAAPASADGTARLAGLAPGLYLVRAGEATARLVVE